MRSSMIVQNRRRTLCGFTLMEMAIGIIIVGLGLAAASQAYSLYLKRQAIATTKANVATVASAVSNYLSITGRYPCPASLTISRNSPAYGHESSASCIDTIYPPGVYARKSARSVTFVPTGNPPPATVTENPMIRVGAVPFRELNLDESQAVDGYGNRIVYAVTARLATKSYYQPDGGGLDVRKAAGTSLLNVPASAHFFIYSAGEDLAGAYSREGAPVSTCPTNFPQNLNCATTDPAAFSVVETVTAPGAGHFDDVVSYFTQSNTPLWELSQADITSIHEKPNGKVGIYQPSDMAINYKTIIPGTTHVSGNVLADQMCDASGNCFPSSLVAGTWPGTSNYTADLALQKGMACPSGQYLISVAHGKPVCQAEIWAACPPGQIVMGISNTSSGALVCSTPPTQCPATTVTLCDISLSLPASLTGKQFTISSTYSKETYTCNNGTWTHNNPTAPSGSNTGLCDCTAALTAHPPYTVSNQACGAGYGSGQTYAINYTFSCLTNGYTSISTQASACVCDPTLTKVGSAACKPAPPYSGTYSTTYHGVCVNNVFSWGPAVPSTQPPGACTCTPTDTVAHPTCLNGMTGTRTITTHYSCPDGTKTVTDDTKTGDCVCIPTTSVTYQACPTGYVPNPRGIQYTANFTCPAGPNGGGVWSAPVQSGSDCIPAPPKVCTWEALSSGSSGQVVGIGPAAGSTCSCGATGLCTVRQGANSYTNYPSCFCQ